MNIRSERGFSLVEMLVAVTVLSIGMLMLAGGSLFVTRDLVRSRQATVATAMAQARLDDLRARAASTSPACTSSQFASSTAATVGNGVSLSWVVPTTGPTRTVRVIAAYRLAAGRAHTDTLSGVIAC